jgi:hypothetical protein
MGEQEEVFLLHRGSTVARYFLRTCNRCGAEQRSDIDKLPPGWFQLTAEQSGVKQTISFDFCLTCGGKLIKWIGSPDEELTRLNESKSVA